MTIPVFDLHCDTADRIAWHSLAQELKQVMGQDAYGPGDEAHLELYQELKHNECMISLEKTAAQPWAQCLACFIPDQYSPEQSAEFYSQIRAYADAQVAKNPEVVAITQASQIRQILESQNADAPRFAAVATIENARLFAADLSLVEKLASQGVLMASISWNAAGPLASGHDTHQGLSAAGKEALAEMERCGMAFDVSHLNDECFAEVARLAKKPFVASHSNSRAVCSHKRNLTDEQFRTIRDCGGVVGLNYCSGFLAESAWGDKAAGVTFDQIAAHIEHWLDLDGADVIALGGDWDGADVPSVVADASCMPSLQEQLVARFGQTIVQKLCYQNALAFFERY